MMRPQSQTATTILAMLALLIAASATTATALPRYALMAGARCASCHVNPSGGQMRTEYGTKYGISAVPMSAHASEDSSAEGSGMFDGKLNDFISIGGDFRTQWIYSAASENSSFHLMTASIYGNAQVTQDIGLYAKFDLVNPAYGNLGGAEVFGLLRVLPGRWYIKAGNFLPNYGWRIDDHTAYTRGGDLGFVPGINYYPGLFFIPNYKDIGIEVGGMAGPLEITGGVYNGSGNAAKIDFEDDKAFLLRLDYGTGFESGGFRVGASGYSYGDYLLGGFMAGAAFGDFVLFGEYSLTDGAIEPFAGSLDTTVSTMAAFAELDFRAIQGLWFIARFDIFDPAQGVADNELKRITAGMEIFPWPFVEFRPQYRLNPDANSGDNFQGLVQMHVWF